MKFFHRSILVPSLKPPEEIIAGITGSWGQWQIAIIIVGAFFKLISIVDILAVNNLTPGKVNYSCADGTSTGSKCVTINGTTCLNFTFINPFNVTTFTEKLKLVCEDEHKTMWIRSCFRLGLVIGSFVTGVCVDRFGVKTTAMTFISLQSLTGVLIISVKHVTTLIIFVLTHGIFCIGINIMPALAVCDVVHNKWRTIALGVVDFPVTIAYLTFPYFYSMYSEVSSVIATFSIILLALLIPLIGYKDSPNYMCLLVNFEKGEEIARYIAKFNKSPMLSNTKIRPAQILNRNKLPPKSSFLDIWKSSKTRKVYVAITCIWFFSGYCLCILLYYTYQNFMTIPIFGMCASTGYMTAIVLCYSIAPHKIVIGIFAFLRSIFIIGLVICDSFWKDITNTTAVVLEMMASLWLFLARAAILNLTPRIFPTELRGTCVGFCYSSYHLGYFFATVIFYYTYEAIWLTALLLILSPVIEAFSCFWLWDVRNRELPDCLMDCIRFDTYYKPPRYNAISYDTVGQEIEVAVVSLSEPNYHS